MKLRFTVPLPVPLLPEVIVSHVGALLVAFQVQPGPALTPKLLVPAVFGTLTLVDDREYVQPSACVTVKICPAMVTVPVRAVPELAAMLSVTVPLPVPLLPLVMVIHGALLVAVQPQAAPVVTLTLAGPPPAGALKLVGLSVYVHGAAAWLTVKVSPAMVTVPVRAVP